MALVFFGDPETPVRCAVELSRALRQHPEIKLRMGIHSGPVYRVADINAARNVAGGGINMAQRVMDCGDAGHILVSNAVADVLGQVGTWSKVLQDLGEAEVKHGVRIHIDNSQRLYRYSMISGIPAADYTGTLDVKPKGSGSSVEWRVQYRANGQPTIIVRTVVTELLKTGFKALQHGLVR